MKNENYITIQGFMVNELHLKGNELLVYAIIYGFTQLENQEFNGSLQYLADWCNSTKQGIIKSLKALIEKGFIEKKEIFLNNVKFISYYATKFNGIKQSLTGYSTEFNEGIKQSLPNNINNNLNIDINNDINNNMIFKDAKTKFVKPTVEEIENYITENNLKVDADTFFNFYEAKGWLIGKNKMQNWKNAVHVWDRKNHSCIGKHNSTDKEKEANIDYELQEKFNKVFDNFRVQL